MAWFHARRSPSRSSPFRNDSVEMFSQPLSCVVEKSVCPDAMGTVKANGGVLWRAELYFLNCQTTLLSGQPAEIIGRRNNVLIVIPCHCLPLTRAPGKPS